MKGNVRTHFLATSILFETVITRSRKYLTQTVWACMYTHYNCLTEPSRRKQFFCSRCCLLQNKEKPSDAPGEQRSKLCSQKHSTEMMCSSSLSETGGLFIGRWRCSVYTAPTHAIKRCQVNVCHASPAAPRIPRLDVLLPLLLIPSMVARAAVLKIERITKRRGGMLVAQATAARPSSDPIGPSASGHGALGRRPPSSCQRKGRRERVSAPHLFHRPSR